MTSRRPCGACRTPRSWDLARDDAGVALVVAVALVGVLVSVLLGLGVVVDLLAARQRAADVADLAALAAVSTVIPTEADACRAAEEVVAEQRARLRTCALVGGDVLLDVSVVPRGPAALVLVRALARPLEIRATARAGRR